MYRDNDEAERETMRRRELIEEAIEAVMAQLISQGYSPDLANAMAVSQIHEAIAASSWDILEGRRG